jgi:hypothetical protein
MKKIIIALIMLNTFSALLAQNKNLPFDANGTKIIFYTEPNFKGKQLVIEANAYEYVDLKVQKIWNNSISSMQVPNGYAVSLCDVDESKGNKVELGDSDYKSYQVADFKKLPIYNLLKWNGTDWDEVYKKQTINFDNKLSYFSIMKMNEK